MKTPPIDRCIHLAFAILMLFAAATAVIGAVPSVELPVAAWVRCDSRAAVEWQSTMGTGVAVDRGGNRYSHRTA